MLVALIVSVFPTSVGVFLADSALSADAACLPHVRGGVSR
ncbi:Hypothetical protein ETEE_2634 [Edwardsiella anguillarum ET080813]|uniref:Uncharacterized protein n=1 Tax=Edwardsiella anguillarum ET080813 TaxID=667120 RepID=A0A076LKV6_9GAMM|nr:Hypothetical protein ETEE_2634 [Edwardsiella anguillarum ET080813]